MELHAFLSVGEPFCADSVVGHQRLEVCIILISGEHQSSPWKSRIPDSLYWDTHPNASPIPHAQPCIPESLNNAAGLGTDAQYISSGDLRTRPNRPEVGLIFVMAVD